MSFLYNDVIDWIESEISAGNLAEGDRLPTEMELAERFGVSRITIKRAMKDLLERGRIVRYRGRGTFIAPGVTPIEPQRSEPAPTGARRIGFVVPELSDLFGVRMFNGIDERCQELGYELVIARSRGSITAEATIIERWHRDGVDGIIVFPVHREFYNETLIRLLLDRFPIVLVDRTLHGVPVSAVLSNHYEASVALTSWMLEQGHTSLAFLSPPSVGTSSLEDRHRGFLDTLETHSYTDTPPTGHRLFLDSVMPGHSGAEAYQQTLVRLRRFLSSHQDITGIVTSEYSLALLANQVLKQDPALARRNIQIACFDALTNYPSAESFPHILQDETGIGRTAVDHMTRLLAGESLTGRTYVPYTLVTDPD
ncbi:MAG TPA: GntR family transcriptional regulator [Thermomicrobiales bacterium]|jgi:GntR family transcriptional regulator of arabinose operon|nr:GntR family transcriptional regulator [Thermomicrobiales bacterium]